MTDVLRASVEFPAAVFTILLGVSALLWIASLVGVGDADEGLDALESVGGGALSDVPIQLVLTVVATVGWAVSVLLQLFVLDSLDGAALGVVGTAAGLVSAAAGVATMAALAPRLARIFVVHQAHASADLIGASVEVRSGTVTHDRGYGDARTPDGTTARVEIRLRGDVDAEGARFSAGDRCLIIDHDPRTGAFVVDLHPFAPEPME